MRHAGILTTLAAVLLGCGGTSSDTRAGLPTDPSAQDVSARIRIYGQQVRAPDGRVVAIYGAVRPDFNGLPRYSVDEQLRHDLQWNLRVHDDRVAGHWRGRPLVRTDRTGVYVVQNGDGDSRIHYLFWFAPGAFYDPHVRKRADVTTPDDAPAPPDPRRAAYLARIAASAGAPLADRLALAAAIARDCPRPWGADALAIARFGDVLAADLHDAATRAAAESRPATSVVLQMLRARLRDEPFDMQALRPQLARVYAPMTPDVVVTGGVRPEFQRLVVQRVLARLGPLGDHVEPTAPVDPPAAARFEVEVLDAGGDLVREVETFRREAGSLTTSVPVGPSPGELARVREIDAEIAAIEGSLPDLRRDAQLLPDNAAVLNQSPARDVFQNEVGTEARYETVDRNASRRSSAEAQLAAAGPRLEALRAERERLTAARPAAQRTRAWDAATFQTERYAGELTRSARVKGERLDAVVTVRSTQRTDSAETVDAERAREGFVQNMEGDLASEIANAIVAKLRERALPPPPFHGDPACRREALLSAHLLGRLADADRAEAGPLPEDVGPLL